MARAKRPSSRVTPSKRETPRLVVHNRNQPTRASVRQALARAELKARLEEADAAVDRWGAGGRSEVLADLDRAVEAAGQPIEVTGAELRHQYLGAAPDDEDRARRLRLERAAIEELVRRGGGPGGAGLPA